MSKFHGNAITWFEIPVADAERAAIFYETLLDTALQQYPSELLMYIFPAGPEGVSGALVERPGAKPSADGPLVFLNVDGQLDAVLQRAHRIEGTVQLPKTMIPGGHGYYACIRDTEGNLVGLHSRN